MAEANKDESDLSFQMLGTNSLDLEGLEQLLEFGHVELIENATTQSHTGVTGGGEVGTTAATIEGTVQDTMNSGSVSSEIKLILDLLGQIESINELVLETGYKLHKAHDRMVDLEFQVKQQDKMAQRIAELEREVSKVVEMETWLDAVIAENDRLKRPLWKKVFNVKDK
ncbi:MAG: hypothetical protein KGS72_13900 [Cyanobacteria bacterium REEB67]|nr:hypothetical protein [Cyanobacteria bacterium REEB67]